MMAGEATPNCWMGCSKEALAVPGVVEVAFRNLIISQFSNPMDIEVVLAELKRLKWDPVFESLSHLKMHSMSLFHRAEIDKWIFKRPYLLTAFDSEMQRALRLPQSSEILWDEAQSYWIMEQSIKVQSSSSVPKRSDTGKPVPHKKVGSGSEKVTCYTCGQEGHYSPDCPNPNVAYKSALREAGADMKRRMKDSDSLICYKCRGVGHRSPDCPSEKTYEAGEKAKKARAASSHTSSPETKKSPAPKNQIDAQPINNLGAPWAPYYIFSAVPKSTIPSSLFSHQSRSLQPSQLPPVLVPSNLVWDLKTTKEYVDSLSHFYYKTRHLSVFNNFDTCSVPAASSVAQSAPADPIALMKALVISSTSTVLVM